MQLVIISIYFIFMQNVREVSKELADYLMKDHLTPMRRHKFYEIETTKIN